MDISTAVAIAVVLLIALWVPVLYLVHPSRQGARTYLVHMVEAAGSFRHWPGHWGSPTDSTGRRRCTRSSQLADVSVCRNALAAPVLLAESATGRGQRAPTRTAPSLSRADARQRG